MKQSELDAIFSHFVNELGSRFAAGTVNATDFVQSTLQMGEWLEHQKQLPEYVDDRDKQVMATDLIELLKLANRTPPTNIVS